MEYLREYTFITRQEYSNLTGVLKTKAAHELRQWFMEDKILPRSPQMPLFPSRMPQGITILMPAPWGSFNSFFIRLLSKPSSGQVS